MALKVKLEARPKPQKKPVGHLECERSGVQTTATPCVNTECTYSVLMSKIYIFMYCYSSTLYIVCP